MRSGHPGNCFPGTQRPLESAEPVNNITYSTGSLSMKHEIDGGLGGLHQATRKSLKLGDVFQKGLDSLVHIAGNLNA